MSSKTLLKVLLIVVNSGIFVCADAQENFEDYFGKKADTLISEGDYYANSRLYPNDALQGLMTPSGFGGFGSYVYGSFGGAYPQVYSHKVDFIATGGFGFGDPVKFVNVSAGVNVLDISNVSNLSFDISISRYLGKGTSVSVGGIQLFASKAKSDAPENTYYVAISHAVQALPSRTPGLSRLTFTLGAGNGRFYEKSLLDSIAGKGEHGTAVFAAVSYELLPRLNVNAEWDGLNLGMSVGSRPFVKSPLSIGVGVTNLTSYSGDKAYLIFSIGYSLSLAKS